MYQYLSPAIFCATVCTLPGTASISTSKTGAHFSLLSAFVSHPVAGSQLYTSPSSVVTVKDTALIEVTVRSFVAPPRSYWKAQVDTRVILRYSPVRDTNRPIVSEI